MTARLNILVVDSEPAHAEALHRALEAAGPGIEIRTTGTLRAYREEVAARRPDLALVDLLLPDGCASDALSLASGGDAFPILVMTSPGDEKAAAAAVQAGALDYIIESPQAVAEVAHSVERALREWRSEAAHRHAQRLARTERQLGIELSRSHSLSDTLGHGLDTALAVSGMDCGGVYLVEDDGSLSLALHRGLSDVFVQAASRYAPGAPNTLIVLRAEPLYFLDDSGDFGLSEACRLEGLKALAILPIKERGSMVACLNVASHTQAAIAEDARAALESVASRLGSTIVRVIAEERLREREAQFRSLVTNIDAIVHHAALDLGDALHPRITYVNPQIAAIVGYGPDEFIQDPELWSKLLHPDDRETVFRQTATILEHEGPLLRHYRLRRKDSGEYRWIEDRVTAVRDSTSGAVSLLGIAQDVTDRRRSEEELRKAHESLARAQRIAHIGSWEHHLPTGERRWSEEMYRILGFPPGSPVDAAKVAGCFPPEELERFERAMAATIADDTPYSMDYRFLRPDGAVRYIHDEGVVIRSEQGQPLWMFGTTQDITDRKRAEEALRHSEERFRALIEHSHDVITLLAADGTILYDSPSIELVLGFSPAERVGLSLFDFLPPEALQHLADEWTTFIQQTGSVTEATETALRHRDGTNRQVEAVATNLLHDPAIRAVVVNYHDVTERKRAETERLELERRLQHAQKLESLGVLAGGIAHDFNNLLMGVLGSLEMVLFDLPSDSSLRQGIEQALGATRRATDLTRQMLAYSGKGRFAVARVDLGALVRENAGFFRAAVAHDVALNVQVSTDTAVTEGDPGQLQQVIMNLITNAAEAIGDRPGAVTLTTGVVDCDEQSLGRSRVEQKPAAGRFAFVQVTDTGSGMDETTLEHLFEPFFTTKFTGRGLGMSAVLGIVRGHGGAILVDSAPGRGTSIRVLLPASDATAEPAEATPPPLRAATPRSGLILIVDDEECVREACRELLRRLGFESLAAASGDEALALIEKHGREVLCVILDLTMPGMNGVDTFHAIKRLKPDARVLISSGFDEEGTLRQFKGGAVDGFIQKPYLLRELQAKLEELV